MKLHNTLTRKTEEFKPIKEGEVSLYTCGPTVYSYYHVGNLRNAVFNDTLRRALQADGFKVKHVMNITDVGHLTSDADEGEDKLEKGAAAEGKSVWDIAEFYIGAFKRDVAELNVLPPNGYSGKSGSYARATDFIDKQIDMVKILLDKGYAYRTEQAIYFDVSKLDDYGKLTGQKLSEKETAARAAVVTDSAKRHPQDFAVWFFALGHFAGHNMRWPSPWGEGFPGWHLECSAIIHNTLGDPIDIHTGAVDLIGTHHTNEIAQTEAAFGNQLANYWVHNEYVLVDGQRMAKSQGNFYTLDEIKQKGYDPLALRLLYLQTHYRGQMNFTWESLEAAQAVLRRLQAWADLKFQGEPAENVDFSDQIEKMKQLMGEDLNTPEALSVLSGIVSKTEDSGIPKERFQELLDAADDLFGLKLADRRDIDGSAKRLIEERQTAREAKNWAESDRLRDELKSAGMEINDTDKGQIWRRL